MITTTGGFSSEGLLREESLLQLASFELSDALELGEIAAGLARQRELPISIEVRLLDESMPEGWTVFHLALPGAKSEQPSWIARKSRVVLATGHSTIFERVLSEEQGVDWYESTGLPEKSHAIHGGGLPINVTGSGLTGILIISGLPQVEDHLFGVEVITQFLARQGELA